MGGVFLVDAWKVDVELLVAFEAHCLLAHTTAHDREANDGGKCSGVHAQCVMRSQLVVSALGAWGQRGSDLALLDDGRVQRQDVVGAWDVGVEKLGWEGVWCSRVVGSRRSWLGRVHCRRGCRLVDGVAEFASSDFFVGIARHAFVCAELSVRVSEVRVATSAEERKCACCCA